MGGLVKTRRVALWAGLLAFLAAHAAHADFVGIDPTSQGKVGYRISRPHHWLVGVTVDRAAGFERLDSEEWLHDQYLGVSATYHRGWFGGNMRFMMTPRRLAPRTRAALVLAPRVVGNAFGRKLSYGVAVHGEANLVDHHWMLLLSPAEIGMDLFTHGSMSVQLFGGLRYAAKGAMIENFFIDPNGHPSERLEELLKARLDSPWEGYVSLVFARRLD